MTSSSRTPATYAGRLKHVDFYSLPRLYDILHAPGTGHDVRVLRSLQRRYGAKVSGTACWLEPACGSARYLREASRYGVRGVGFDLEPRMVRFARRASRGEVRAGVARRGTLRLFAARMEDFDTGRRLPRIDFAFNLINTIRHLMTDAAMASHLRAVGRVLEPRGVYVVGLSLAAYGQESITEDVWKGRSGKTRVSQVVQYLPPTGARGAAARTERVVSHLTIIENGRERHLDSTYALRGYSLAQWLQVVALGGMEVVATVDSDGRMHEPSEPGYFLFVLRASARLDA